MITLDAFLVFLCAASLPVIYLLICSRWIEPACQESVRVTPGPEKAKTEAGRKLSPQPA